MSGRPSWLHLTPEDFGYETEPEQGVLLSGDETDTVGTAPLPGVGDDHEIGCTVRI